MTARKKFDLSVYFVADPAVCAGRPVEEIVDKAIEGGVTIVQLRNKAGPVRDFIAQARALKALTARAGIPLIVNDRADVALAADADGVHLGREDFPPEEARAVLGPDKIIGVTAFEEAHMQAIDPVLVDYAGTGPFFPTLTKPDKAVLGPDFFARRAAFSPVPVVGIGGITPENAAAVIEAGASGVAMMRAISEADDPEEAARAFVRAVSNARLRRAG